MSQRTASVIRETRETKIEIDLNLDGQGKCTCSVGLGFLEHMLELLCAFRHTSEPAGRNM